MRPKKYIFILCLVLASFFLSSDVFAYSVHTVNNLVSVSSQVFNPTDSQWATINNGTVTIPYTQNITHISQGGRQPVFFLRNVNGFIPLGGTLTGSYFSGYISIALTGYGNMIDYNSCEGIEADLYPANATIHEKNLRVSSCSVEYGNQTSVMYIQVDVAGSFYGVTSFTDFHFSINNSSNYLVKCNSNSDGPTTYCSSSDYWGISYIDQAWSASNDPNTGYLQDINVNINNINDSINEYHEHEYESVDNISNQSSSDIPDAENQTSSNLINAIASFTGAISSISVAEDCSFVLPFPVYAGGDVPVNLCQYKEKAPEIVLTFGSITLIAVAVGFWVRCIISLYRLIRSFIDGIDDGHYIDIEAID